MLRNPANPLLLRPHVPNGEHATFPRLSAASLSDADVSSQGILSLPEEARVCRIRSMVSKQETATLKLAPPSATRAISKSTGRCARIGGCYPNSGCIWLAGTQYSIEQSAIMQAINTHFCLWPTNGRPRIEAQSQDESRSEARNHCCFDSAHSFSLCFERRAFGRFNV